MTGRASGLAFIVAAIVAGPSLFVARGAVAAGPTFTVDSLLDQPDDLSAPGTCHTAANTCTLRAAVMQANRTSGLGATIMVPSGLYSLTIPAAGADGEENGDLNLTSPVGSPVITIIGAGANTTIIDANQLDRVLHVHPDRTTSISGVTIRNGYPANPQLFAGGIYNEGSLTVSNVTISGNQSTDAGGGIFNTGSLTVMNGTISQNSADQAGGGVHNEGSLAVIDSTISQNNAGTRGGGIDYQTGTLIVSNSTLYHNSAYDGGGIFVDLGYLFVINSTISQNSANNDGGGINNHGTANVYNTTIVFNGADADRDGGSAGGVFNSDGLGAIFNLRNTLVAGNDVGNTPIYDECTGTLNSYGRNLFGADVACTIQIASGTWDYLNSLNTLGQLQNNGGPTQTHALLQGSNAIDGGDPVFGCTDYNGSTIATDQRGTPRVAGVRCDIGAYEVPEPDSMAAVAVAIATLASMRRTMRCAR